MSCRVTAFSANTQLLKTAARTNRRSFFRPSVIASTLNIRNFTASIIMTDKFEEAKKAAPEKDQWKFAPPYSMHDPKEFKARYEASCHCGKVKYQLSREKPLDSKLCHCTTCQTQHGKSFINGLDRDGQP